MQADLLDYLTAEERKEFYGLMAALPCWIPDPRNKPQCAAYESEADIIGYGGAAGGGKTDLLLGFAGTKHTRSIIFRRVFPLLESIEARSREIYNPTHDPRVKDRYNESLHRWQLSDGATVRFAAMQHEDDKKNFQGRPHDFYGFDEATEFTESQVRFVMGWNRSIKPGQKCRVVLTFNPPIDESGEWVVRFFAPWLDSQYPKPAQDGELRCFAMIDGKETEVESGEPFEHNGETLTPRSRTFFHAKLSDNVILEQTGYAAIIDSMPDELRLAFKGNFGAYKKADPFQVIPVTWVRAAQKRWLERERPTTPLTAVGIDPSRGGNDKHSIAKRYDNWFDVVVSYPGAMVTDGAISAELTRQILGEEKPGAINIDVNGIGSSSYDHIKVMYSNVRPFNGAEASKYRDRSGKLKMRNKRAEMYWRMRDTLDPIHGDDVALPPGNEIIADLCSAKYSVSSAGVLIEEKEEIKARIGRSPDEGEAIMMSNMESLSAADAVDFA
jgi:hypothetical protein